MQSTEPNIKRKNQSPMRIIVNRWGFLLGFLMLGLGVAMGLLAAIFVGPALLGFDVTATALMEQEIALVATQVELDVQAQDALVRATGFALDVQATQAIINNNADLLDQTATQSAQYIVATHTASAIQNSQRITQVANDFIATQAALNANATQVDIDFRNTQAALGIGSAQSDSNPRATPLPGYHFDMTNFDFDSAIWQLSDELAWQASNIGILANSESAWIRESDTRILSSNGFEDTYTIEALISPATVVDADYWILFSMTEESGLAAYFHANTLTVNQLGLYRFDLSQLDDSLDIDNLTLIQDNTADVSLTGQTQFSVRIEGEIITLFIGDEAVLEVNDVPVESGAIGVQLPAQSTLLSIAVND